MLNKPSRYQRSFTGVQKVMAVLMAIAFTSLGLWLIPEVRGIFNSKSEDTWSEAVWDLPLPLVLVIAALHLLAGVLFVWSAGHFIEGWFVRRG